MVHLTTNGSTGPPGSQCRWQVVLDKWPLNVCVCFPLCDISVNCAQQCSMHCEQMQSITERTTMKEHRRNKSTDNRQSNKAQLNWWTQTSSDEMTADQPATENQCTHTSDHVHRSCIHITKSVVRPGRRRRITCLT